ncbi:patched domain-containing protein 3-like [Conger conger]|uniref:patched domain-containing protein 3-like n=1 Tax=Conger conger TaxID=82655 RepID=UPI002A5A65A0|nr:patched domain-containing protein 3-like [Conger conger]
MASCVTDCVSRRLSNLFEQFGGYVGSNPLPFFIIPLFLSACLGGGFYFLEDREANDIEDQFTPVNGPAKYERRFVMENFPYSNNSMFSSQRLYTEGTYASFIAKNKRNVLTNEIFKQIITLDETIRNVPVKADQETINFSNICAKSNDMCVSNAILEIIDYNNEMVPQTKITFPTYRNGSEVYFLGSEVGGVTLSEDNVVENAKAIRLYYYLWEDEAYRQKVNLWLDEFVKIVSNYTTANSFEVSYFTSRSRQEELEANTKEVIPLFSVTYFLVITFSIVSCLRLDHVWNKVWVATFGVLSAGLAVLSSFGLLLYSGVPFAMTVATAPFLILGIGVDDMFIMISAWQQTNICDPVHQRLADTYKEAAMSITITTLTNLLAFYIGLMTQFRSVQSFCLYTGTAILFCYIYNVTFFGAFMALDGQREEKELHWLTCKKVEFKNSIGRYKCSSKYCRELHVETEKKKVHLINDFFRDFYGPFLTKLGSKAFLTLLYATYLAGSIYNCTQIKEGIDLRNLAPDTSYVVKYYSDEDLYFSTYGPSVMVILDGEFQYWNKTERATLNSSLEIFQSLPFIDKSLFVSWLDIYENYAKNRFHINNETEFKSHLPGFLEKKYFKQDVNFTNGNIYASRFFIQTVNITDGDKEKNMLTKLREVAVNCSDKNKNYYFMVYHPAFIYFDQYVVIVNNTIQNILVATAAMLVISLLLIPNIICSLWVTFAIASVIIGVVGFMTLWDVNLDSISMINLVICIGFSVDFSAHIAYAFISSSEVKPDKKAVDALHKLGYPIVQGAVSTILGLVALSTSPSYIFRTFFKILFLVILFGAAHGIAFIPVFLTFFFCDSSAKVNNENEESDAGGPV